MTKRNVFAQKYFVLLSFSALLISCSSKRRVTDQNIPSETEKNIFVAEYHQKDRNIYSSKGSKFVIATQGKAASKAAQKMFELGGNAIDAAAAVSFVISVERPQSTGLGGGGFMLIHLKGFQEPLAVDFREKAPERAFKNMYINQAGEIQERLSKDGVLASGVPGTVAGVLEVHEKYGRLSLDKIIAPAILLAENGFKVYPHLANAIESRKEVLSKSPSALKIFFKKNGRPLVVGDLLIQQDLAKTLREISKNGRSGFYRGKVGAAILDEFSLHGGLISRNDLLNYDVKYRKPVHSVFNKYDIYSMPPPSSGGIHIIQILNIIENRALQTNSPLSVQNIHSLASAMQMAFADRAKYLGDSDFVPVPVKRLTSDIYAKKRSLEIDSDHARSANEVFAGKIPTSEPSDTTHFSIMDAEGNVVTSTQTINGLFGSGVVIPGTGIVMNNEMDDFSAKPGSSNLYGAIGGEPNSIQANKRPLSSMSPTIVFKDSHPILALGSPSGTRILTCVALSLVNYLEFKLPLYESLSLVRYHHQWKPDHLFVEKPGFNAKLNQSLSHMGYSIEDKDLGCKVQAVANEDGFLIGASDPRGEGMSIAQ